MSLKKNYLLAYNAALIFGWALVLTVTAKACITLGPKHVYENVEVMLLVAQTAAVMEVLHAMFGIARSPVLVTAMQGRTEMRSRAAVRGAGKGMLFLR